MALPNQAADAAAATVRTVRARCGADKVMGKLSRACNSGAQFRRLRAAALQFSLRDPRVTSTICGVTKPERVKQTLDWARFPIPEAVWEELKAAPFSTDDPEATREYKPG